MGHYTDAAGLFSQMPSFKKQVDLNNEAGQNYVIAMEFSQTDADAIIDSVLDKLYSVPFPFWVASSPGPNNCPPIVTTIAGMLSRSIFLSGQYLADPANAQPRASMVLWDRAWMMLNKILSGDMQVVGPETSPVKNYNLGIWVSKNKVPSPLKNFDLESPLYPRLHDRMRGNQICLRFVADDGTLSYYSGCSPCLD